MPKQNSEQETYSRNIGFDMKIEYDGSGRQLYIGFAYPKKATSDAAWQIYKLAYDVSGRPVTRRYADGTDSFTKSWDLRATYDYVDI